MFYEFGKIQNPFHWMGDASVPAFLQFLVVLSEFAGGLVWMIGVVVPLASFGIFYTMAIAVFMHVGLRGDPFVSQG